MDKPQALPSGHFLRYIPDGKSANAGAFKAHAARTQRPAPIFYEAQSLEATQLDPGSKRSRAPTALFADLQDQHTATIEVRSAAAASSPKRVRSLKSSDVSKKRGGGGGHASLVPKEDERPVNPNCTNTNPCKCYCRSGRARAVVRVDSEGNVIKEYCGASVAAAKLEVGPSGITECCSGVRPSTKGMFFRYKEDGEGHKHGAHVVLHVDGTTGEVLQEFATANDAMRALGVRNSAIGMVIKQIDLTYKQVDSILDCQ